MEQMTQDAHPACKASRVRILRSRHGVLRDAKIFAAGEIPQIPVRATQSIDKKRKLW